MSETLPGDADTTPLPTAPLVDVQAAVDAPTEVSTEVSTDPPTLALASADAEATPPTPATPATPAKPVIPELSPAACATRLGVLFPALFGRGALPLKLRIQADIQARAPGVFTRKSLSAFLHRYTTGTAYLMAITQAAQRVDLDGAPAGEIAAEHRQAAQEELARRRSLFEARRAAENASRRAAEEASRREHAAADQARRERAGVLRAFETSTLTRANFCALKGLLEADLDALLSTAREEAAHAPQAPHAPHAPRENPNHEPQRPGRAGQRPEAGNRPGRGHGPRGPGRGGAPSSQR